MPQRTMTARHRASGGASTRKGRSATDARLAGLSSAARAAPAVARLSGLQAAADSGSAAGVAPVQRKVVINGRIYGSKSELALSKDDAFMVFRSLDDAEKDAKLAASETYTIEGNKLVGAPEDLEAEAPVLAETAEQRQAREAAEQEQQRQDAIAYWTARIAWLKAKIAAKTYRTHGRSFAHLNGRTEQLVKFGTKTEVYDYLAGNADEFECVGAQEFDGKPAGVFRLTIASQHMLDTSKRGSVILLLLPTRQVVLHHFGNI